MSVTTCSACVLAASAGGAVGGYLAVGKRGRAEAGGPSGAAARCGPGRAACVPIRVRSAAADPVDAAGIRSRSGISTMARGERPGVR